MASIVPVPMNESTFLDKVNPENPITKSAETKCFEHIFLNWKIRSVADLKTSMDWRLFLKINTKSFSFFPSEEVVKT